MKFIFWQNAISIHQSSFLENLAQSCEVILIVEKEQSQTRLSQGWHRPEMRGVRIIVAPNLEEIKLLLSSNLSSWHFFSGIYANKMVKTALMIAVNHNMKVAVIAEAFREDGYLGFLRKLRNLWYCIKLRKKIKLFLPIGDLAVNQYSSIGYPNKIMFEWAYYTDREEDMTKHSDNDSNLPDIIYVGQLIPRKNVINLVRLLSKHSSNFNSFKIIGTGELEDDIKEIIKPVSNIFLCGAKSNFDVQDELSVSDFLILPSIFDGWGAVVNESLMAGTPALVSSNCGATSLLKEKYRGESFNLDDQSLEEVITKWIKKGKTSNEQRSKIVKWSIKNISGVAASSYFKDIVDFKENITSQKPLAPWNVRIFED